MTVPTAPTGVTLSDVSASAGSTVLAYLPSPPRGVWELGPVPIRAYALCIIVGIIVAVWWGNRRWIARGGQDGEVLDVAIWAVPFGLIGGRLYHVATDWSTYFGDGPKEPIDALKIWDGGLGIWGAVLFGALGAWIGARRMGIKLPPFGDAIAPPILLAQGIGRLGNYFNQELYGRETTVPWGLQIFERVDADGQVDLMAGTSNGHVVAVVHPTFLYELLWNVLVVILLVVIDRRFRIGHGRLFAMYVAAYCVGRFFIELMRSDHATEIFGVRINVFTSIIVFACAAAYVVLAPRGREVGLSIYWPWRAEQLADEGAVGYVDDQYDDDQYDDDRYEDDGVDDHDAALVAAGDPVDTDPDEAAAVAEADAGETRTVHHHSFDPEPADPEPGHADPVPVVTDADAWTLESAGAATDDTEPNDERPADAESSGDIGSSDTESSDTESGVVQADDTTAGDTPSETEDESASADGDAASAEPTPESEAGDDSAGRPERS